MRAIIKTFESGAGDCIFLVMKDEMEGSSFHVMMDCNVLTDDIKTYIRDELNKHIDVLIVTHIDSDHANGITKGTSTELCQAALPRPAGGQS
jgi:phosphoribosyl 1,2-cyclic phosphodiesterase